ncbi:MAG TPA: hypothetical protein VGM28_03830 [Candidatus Limnocylindrales bacterium]
MTGRPTDEELREMLEARASGASTDAAREAMAGLRAATRGTSDARGGFAVLPVSIGSRGARLPGSIAAIGLVAVLLIAVVGGQLSTPKESASAAAAGTHVPESIPTLAVAGPDQAAVPDEAMPGVWTGVDLASALTAKSIVGQVIVVSGALTTRLCNPGGSCVVDIDGLEGVPVVFPRAPNTPPDLVGPGGRTALRVRSDGGLDYLGQLDADALRPETVDALVHEGSAQGRGLFVGGWLLPRSSVEPGGAALLPVPRPAGSVAPGRDAILSGSKPNPDGLVNVGSAVVVGLGADYQQDPRTLTRPFTFLLASAGGGWQVDGIVAATIQEPDEAVASSAPPLAQPPLISLPVLGVPLSADELRSHLADGSLDGRLVVIDGRLALNQLGCGLRPNCAVPFIRGLDNVPMAADDATNAALGVDLPDAGPHVFAVRDGTLEYLGIEPADVDHPLSMATLLARGPRYGQNALQLQLVSGWLVEAGFACPTVAQPAAPCLGPASWLTDDQPTRRGGLATGGRILVALRTTAPDGPVVQGPFLVRRMVPNEATVCDASPGVDCTPVVVGDWQVVAILGPDSPLRSPLR